MRRLVIGWLVMLVLVASVGAQEAALASKLSEGGAEWILGTWAGVTSEGQSLTLTYGQELGGQAGSVHFKMEGLEMKGLIVVDPSTDEVTQFAATSSGALVSGTWSDEGDGLVFQAVWRMPDGSRIERSYAHQRVDAETMRVVVREGSRWASDADTYEIVLKRKS